MNPPNPEPVRNGSPHGRHCRGIVLGPLVARVAVVGLESGRAVRHTEARGCAHCRLRPSGPAGGTSGPFWAVAPVVVVRLEGKNRGCRGQKVHTISTARPPVGVFPPLFRVSQAQDRFVWGKGRVFGSTAVFPKASVSSSTGSAVRTLTGHTDWVNAVAVSPDGQWIVSGSNDNTVRIWQFSDGMCGGGCMGCA